MSVKDRELLVSGLEWAEYNTLRMKAKQIVPVENMRRILLIMMAVFPTWVFAESDWRKYRWELETSLAIPSIYMAYENEDYFNLIQSVSVTPVLMSLADTDCYDVFISPTASVRAAYRVSTRVHAVSSLGVNLVRAQYYNPFTVQEVRREHALACDMMLGARYTFVEKSSFRFYSQLMLGFNIRQQADYWEYSKARQSNLKPDNLIQYYKLPYWMAYQFEIGITVGRRLYGVFDGGIGTEHLNGAMIGAPRIGVGYRF